MAKINLTLALLACLTASSFCNISIYIIHDKKYETNFKTKDRKQRCAEVEQIGIDNNIVSYILKVDSMESLNSSMKESPALFTKFSKDLNGKKLTQTPRTLDTEAEYTELIKCMTSKNANYAAATELQFNTYQEISEGLTKITKSSNTSSVVTVRFLPAVETLSKHREYSRILAEDNTSVLAANGNTYIYVSSPGILGILFSIFCIVVFYIGVKCALEVDAPANFAENEFKYGREM